jgi:hypothetical protein
MHIYPAAVHPSNIAAAADFGCLQAHVLDSMKRLVHAVVPDILPAFVLEAAAAEDSPISKLTRLLSKLEGASLFWWAWLLCPGLQTAYIMLFFAQRSPIKVVYASIIGERERSISAGTDSAGSKG